jgi:hypothetical protein
MITKSDGIGGISKALAAFQGDVEACKKTADNPFYKTKYADLPSILAVIKPHLKNHNIAVVQSIDTVGDGGLICYTMLLHGDTGEWMQSTDCLMVEKQSPQGYGSARTYLRRYAIQAALGLSAEDDDAESAETPHRGKPEQNRTPVAAVKPKPQEAKKPEAATVPKEQQLGTISEKQQKMLFAKMSAKGMSKEEMKDLVFGVAGVEHSNEIQRSDMDSVLEAIEHYEASEEKPTEGGWPL